MTFKAEIKTTLGWNWEAGALDSNRLDYARQFAEGHDEGQAEAVWHADDQTLAEGNSVALDLTALVREVLGDTLTTTLLSVKGLLIVNQAGSEGRLIVGGSGGDEWSAPFGADGATVEVPPDGTLLLAGRQAGWPVDDANKLLKLAASGGDVSYAIAVLGTVTASGSGSGSGA